MAAFDIHK